MTAIQFYHLTATPLERALPKLLEKALAAGNRILLLEENDQRRDHLNQLLWTYDPGSFLPHGSTQDGDPQDHPILLSPGLENANNANLLLVADGRTVENTDGFARILDMFDGRNDEATASARVRWKQYKGAGHTLTYLRQTEQGGWEQSASTTA